MLRFSPPNLPRRALAVAALALCACDTVGTIGEAPADFVRPEPEAPPPPFAPAPAQLLRLTTSQYRNVVHDVFGDDVQVAVAIEPDTRVAGFTSVGAGEYTVSRGAAGRYEDQALEVAGAVMGPGAGAARATLAGCTPEGVTDATCAGSFIARYGRLLYRRSLTAEESARLLTLANDSATARSDFYAGLEMVVAALLQSPHFLYRHELGALVDDTGAEPAGYRELRGTELASRLSFFLWDTAPDAQLLEDAETGALDTPEGREAVVRRMVDDPRARRGLRVFFADMLELFKLDQLSKDRETFPHFTPELRASAREETLRTIEHHVFDADADYRDLMTTPTTFIDRRLAAVYDVPAPATEGFGRFEHPARSMRRGLLGQWSFLAMNAHATHSSPTRRGQFVRMKLLCTEVPPPPANVAVELDPTDPSLSARDRLAEHRVNPVCASCHSLMDPIGLGFENFDGIGRYSEEDWRFRYQDGALVRDENGDPVRVRGPELDVSGDVDGVPYETPIELTEALRNHPDLTRCVTSRLYSHATGHAVRRSEAAQVVELHDRFLGSGFRLKELLVQVALSVGFRQASGLRGDVAEETEQ